MTDSFCRLVSGGKAVYKVRRSEFIAAVYPASSVEAAQRAVEEVKAEQRNATHNCWAWRTEPIGRRSEASSDDGEPAGTAGRPILGELCRLDLWDAVVIVTRYFGGVKLGPRGLIEAYSFAASETIGHAQKEFFLAGRQVTLVTDYERQTALAGLLRRHGLEGPGQEAEREYGETVKIRLFVPLSRVLSVTEATGSYEWNRLLVEAPAWGGPLWRKAPAEE